MVSDSGAQVYLEDATLYDLLTAKVYSSVEPLTRHTEEEALALEGQFLQVHFHLEGGHGSTAIARERCGCYYVWCIYSNMQNTSMQYIATSTAHFPDTRHISSALRSLYQSLASNLDA